MSTDRRTLRILFVASLLVTLAYWLFLFSQGAPLSVTRQLADGTTVDQLPSSIVAFEFATTGTRAAEIVALWRDNDLLDVARDQVLFDFIFLFLYPTTIALGCLLVRRHFGPPDSRLHMRGQHLAKGQVMAGVCDALENMALLRVLGSEALQDAAAAASDLDFWARAAAIFAAIKFALVLAGIAYAATGLVRGLLARRGATT